MWQSKSIDNAKWVGQILIATLAFANPLSVVAQEGSDSGGYHVEGVAEWFNRKFEGEDLDRYNDEDFRIEQHLCNCSDVPVPHYPYVMVFFTTPKGDLVGRPERRGFDTVVIPLAERHGTRYCELHSEEQCFGSFADPCEFSDFRYGEQLAPYFPTCKPERPEPEIPQQEVRYQSR